MRVKIFDTTLRDGEQGIGCKMSIEQKKQALLKLDTLNLDYIEVGLPAASGEDARWIKAVLKMKLKTPICLFSRMHSRDIKNLIKIIQDEKVIVQLLGLGSEGHLSKKMSLSLEEALLLLEENIIQLREAGVADIALILEDATRGSYKLLKAMVEKALQLNIKMITFADTVGRQFKSEVQR